MKSTSKAQLLCRVTLALLALALVCATAIPLLRSAAWWIRIFDFPRLQIAVLIGLTLVGYLALRLWRGLRPWDYALATLAGLALVWQLMAIAPYTTFYPQEMSDSHADDEANRVSLLIYNVLADNREVQALRDLIRDTDPDLILLSETTQWWLEQLDGLQDDYPFTLYQPQENNYGMLLYSRLELVNPQIRFLLEPEVPSMRAQVRLRSGKRVTLYSLHPRPPGLKPPEDEENDTEENEDAEREDADKRDAELLMVAKEVKELGDVPVIVAGDFNDVAWSYTTDLFQRTSGLLDPRVGRGLHNTFDSRNRLLRYPLDHSFASKHFQLAELRRLPNIGSDHFPLLVVYDYAPDAAEAHQEPKPEAGDEQQVDEAIDEGKSSD